MLEMASEPAVKRHTSPLALIEPTPEAENSTKSEATTWELAWPEKIIKRVCRGRFTPLSGVVEADQRRQQKNVRYLFALCSVRFYNDSITVFDRALASM